jgi:hypothetical protein
MLIDESRDISVKEKIVVMLSFVHALDLSIVIILYSQFRYVDVERKVIEWFLT